MRQIREVLRLKWATGLTHREIARACGTGAATVADYVRRAREAGLGWPLPDELDDSALQARLFPPAAASPGPDPSPTWLTCTRRCSATA